MIFFDFLGSSPSHKIATLFPLDCRCLSKQLEHTFNSPFKNHLMEILSLKFTSFTFEKGLIQSILFATLFQNSSLFSIKSGFINYFVVHDQYLYNTNIQNFSIKEFFRPLNSEP